MTMKPLPFNTINRTRGPAPSARERFLSLALIGLLVLIAVALYAYHDRFDPGKWRAQAVDAALSAPGLLQPDGPHPSVEGLRSMSPSEVYDAANLSDKINGKAELYLAAGFERLATMRFALVPSVGPWLEQFVYTMESYNSAYAVFSQQRRAEATPLEVTADAYRSSNGIFMVHGNFYVEIIGSEPSPLLMEKAADLANAFVDDHPVQKRVLDERTLFPEADRATDAVTLTAANAFGFDRFDQIFSAPYQWEQHGATAFLSRRASADEAKTLAEAYSAFLLEYGGKMVEPPSSDKQMVVIEILDSFEIVFSRGEFLGGVHEATDLQRALMLAGQLYRNLEGHAGER